jgi:hypothetical protein
LVRSQACFHSGDELMLARNRPKYSGDIPIFQTKNCRVAKLHS